MVNVETCSAILFVFNVEFKHSDLFLLHEFAAYRNDRLLLSVQLFLWLRASPVSCGVKAFTLRIVFFLTTKPVVFRKVQYVFIQSIDHRVIFFIGARVISTKYV